MVEMDKILGEIKQKLKKGPQMSKFLICNF